MKVLIVTNIDDENSTEDDSSSSSTSIDDMDDFKPNHSNITPDENVNYIQSNEQQQEQEEEFCYVEKIKDCA
ncbi:hypothetical protein DLAC_10367 [Tieghemostelium lacteum]|uniref:Uncharacterized protein n=1 Tax=Tieghemostelium lacteum TaxID=361077 RepID=A0A151Z5E0_TIELA|nr:hypothetical protein DLAC_10367 [Tieghemostelium lacteum]|eukprot:KYQ89127.1 hypothetical protein DLAC_10367 [Tieghemostelium lacteum]